MCLSTAYSVRGDEKKRILEDVSQIELSEGKVVLTDFLGSRKVIPGKILSVDLVSNVIYLSVPDEPETETV